MYQQHKLLTVILETTTFIVAFVTTFIDKLDSWARISGALVALIIGVCAVIRSIWEIKIKRREHEIRMKQKEISDQILWREVAHNKSLHNGQDEIIKLD